MNSSLMHARSMEAINPPTNDERRAQWASKYFAAGYHRIPSKPRVRLQPTQERAGRTTAGKES